MHLPTKIVQAGRDPAKHDGVVAPPITRGSTVLLPDAATLIKGAVKDYGLEGHAVQEALAAVLAEIEGGTGAVLLPSGLSACTLPFLALLQHGDHVLVTDSVYRPTRRLCQGLLKRMGVTTTFYRPGIGAEIEALLQPSTKLIWIESPGSLTFEVEDVPALTAVARAHNVLTAIDNTWSAGVYFKPFQHGVDLSIQAMTKYQSGGSDAFGGAVIGTDAKLLALIAGQAKELGLVCPPDDAWLILRGLRSMPLRLATQDAAARQIAQWLAGRPEITAVLHPAIPSYGGHALWARDFTGAGGLFSVELAGGSTARAHAFINALKLFGIGYSWGGYESLVIPGDPQIAQRALAQPERAGPLIRLQIGLESPEDLIADLAQALQVWGTTPD